MTKTQIPGVTVAIPTFNRSQLLKKSLQSVLSQTYADLEVLVLDNASVDDTTSVVKALSDPRVKYLRNSENTGLFRNWNRAISNNNSPYLAILPDDDELCPDFVEKSLAALEASPNVAFSFAKTSGIGMDGEPVAVSDEFPAGGVISGLDLLHQFVTGTNWVIQPSTVMMRAMALDIVGSFDTVHSRLSIDLNLYLRLAAQFDVAFVPEVLARNRIHPGQVTEQSHRTAGGTGPLATLAERMDAIAQLLRSDRGKSDTYRQWLSDRLMHLGQRRSEMTADLVPDLNLAWDEKLEILKDEVRALVPAGETFVLIDDDRVSDDLFPGRHAAPLMQSDGQSLGAPPDAETAVQELQRLHRSGVNFVVIVWPAFWWLDYYIELREYLEAETRCVLHNSRVVVYELAS